MPNVFSDVSSLRRPLLPAPESLLAEVLAGLQQPQKTLPCKLFYDAYGSQLFDQICELEEYYPTRTEVAIMRRHIGAMAACIGDGALLVEYGSGSSFKTQAARAFLRRVARLCGPHGGLLLGVDLKKDVARLEAAYNDRKGVTAAFNLNLLRHVNRAFQGSFRLDRFAHRAHYNAACGRIEMHLVSLAEQRASVAGRGFAFGCGETIHTENSYKYSVEGFARLAGAAGWTVARVWTDDAQCFSVQYLTPASAG